VGISPRLMPSLCRGSHRAVGWKTSHHLPVRLEQRLRPSVFKPAEHCGTSPSVFVVARLAQVAFRGPRPVHTLRLG